MKRKPINANNLPFDEFKGMMDEEFTTFIHNLPNELVSYIKTKILESRAFFDNTFFQLELVVDTNIIFSEVRSLMLNDSSFFLKIADNPLIRIYAPSQLKDELYEKIKLKFPKENKTKHLNIDECLAKADLFISKITLRDDFTTASWDKAKSYMQERDAKDISFVALNFTLKTHGIITKDKDISDNIEIKTWKLAEAGKVITEVNKGTFSFFIIDLTLPPILKTIYEIVSTIWHSFLEVVNGLIKLFSSIFAKSFSAIAQLPPELGLVVGFAAIIILLTDELREKVGEFFKMLWEQIKKFIKVIKELFKAIWEVFKDIFESLKPVLTISVQLLGYFLLESGNVMNRLKELEAVRPSED